MDGNKTEKVIINQDLIQAYKMALKEFKENLDKSNDSWFGVVRLIITLSTSILLVSIGLIDKIFPLKDSKVFIKNILVLGWVLFFMSIILGIITELKNAEFRGKMAKNYEPLLKHYLLQMTKGQFGQQEVDLAQSFILYSSLFWGLSEIVTFIFGVLCLSLYSIGNICVLSVWHVIAIMVIVIIVIGGLIVRYFKNR